jgi:hypothetical protein
VPKAPLSPAPAISQKQVITRICSRRPPSSALVQPLCTTSLPRRATRSATTTRSPLRGRTSTNRRTSRRPHQLPDAGMTAGRSEPPFPTEPHAAREQRSTARVLEPPRFQVAVTPTSAEAARDCLLAAAEHRWIQIGPEDPTAQPPEPPPLLPMVRDRWTGQTRRPRSQDPDPARRRHPRARPAAAPPSWLKPPATIREACAGTPPRPPRAPAT